jgi:hypothetical protein
MRGRALYFSAPNSAVPLWSAFEKDRDAGRVLVHSAKPAFTAAVRPYWTDVRANHHSELAQHGRLLACRGVGAALTAMLPGASWCGDSLLIDSPQDRTVQLGGRGLLITPTSFWTGPPLVGELPEQPVLLAYPAPAVLGIRVGAESDSLAAIPGATRAAVLRLSQRSLRRRNRRRLWRAAGTSGKRFGPTRNELDAIVE